MKYFLCAFNTIYLGILSERTERVISVSRKQSCVYETEGNDAFISLPHLFERADLPAPHGIILKAKNEEKKTILLAPPLDIDLEIPEEDIFSVPKVLGGKLLYFRGACFIKKNQEECLILILDMEKLKEDFP